MSNNTFLSLLHSHTAFQVILWTWSRSGSCAREDRVLHQAPARERSPNHECVNGSKRADSQRSPGETGGIFDASVLHGHRMVTLVVGTFAHFVITTTK